MQRPRPEPRVAAWLNGNDASDLRISVLTLGELLKGAVQIERRNPQRGVNLRRWLDTVRADYGDCVLDVDAAIAETWGNLAAVRTLPVVDGLLAATALVHGLTLVTRNARDVAGTGVEVLDPWHG